MTTKTVHVAREQHELLRKHSFNAAMPIQELVRLSINAYLGGGHVPQVANAPLNSKSKKQRSKRWSPQFKQTLAKGAQQ